jgi:hypothetical protein
MVGREMGHTQMNGGIRPMILLSVHYETWVLHSKKYTTVAVEEFGND